MRQADFFSPEDNDLFLGFQAILFHQDFGYVGVEMPEAGYMYCFSEIQESLRDFVFDSVDWREFLDNDNHFG